METQIEQLKEEIATIRREFDLKLQLALEEQRKVFESLLATAERKARTDILGMVGSNLMNAIAPMVNAANNLYVYKVCAVSETEEVNSNTFYAQRQGGTWAVSTLLDGKVQVFNFDNVVTALKEKVEEFLSTVPEDQAEIAFNVYRM